MRWSAEKRVEEILHSKPKRFERTDRALYTEFGVQHIVTVVCVHHDDKDGEYYTIKRANGTEKQTVSSRLKLLPK